MHKMNLERHVKKLKQVEKCKRMGEQYRNLAEAHAVFKDSFEKNKKSSAKRPALYASGNALLPEIEKFRWNLPGYFEKKLGAGPCQLRQEEANAWFSNLLETDAVLIKKVILPWNVKINDTAYFERNIDSAFILGKLKDAVIRFNSNPVYKYVGRNGKESVTGSFSTPDIFGAILSGSFIIKKEEPLHPDIVVRIEIHAPFEWSGTQTIAIIQPQIPSSSLSQ